MKQIYKKCVNCKAAQEMHIKQVLLLLEKGGYQFRAQEGKGNDITKKRPDYIYIYEEKKMEKGKWKYNGYFEVRTVKPCKVEVNAAVFAGLYAEVSPGKREKLNNNK